MFIKKGTGERRDADDKEVREHPERFTSHGDDYKEEKRRKERERRQAAKDRERRKR